MRHHLRTLTVVLSIAFLVGCSATAPSPSPQQLSQGSTPIKRGSAGGKASGLACGIELFDFVPIGIWSRTERAYSAALDKAGARALLAPTYSDSRIDLMVATLKCSAVEGTAVY